MTRADELLAIIASAQAELEALRKTCPHESYRVGWWSWRLGSQSPARICDTCHFNIREPDQAETNAFMAEERARRAKFLRDSYDPEMVREIESASPFQDPWSKPVQAGKLEA